MIHELPPQFPMEPDEPRAPMPADGMRFESTIIPGVVLIEPRVFEDPRGFFMEIFQKVRFQKAGLESEFVQDNHSRSCQATLRGLHYQITHPQGKLVRVIRGEVFDVAVDLRRRSPTFGQWFGARLSETNRRQLYIPPGLAHGFCVTSESAEFLYKCTDYYYPEHEPPFFGMIRSWPSIGRSRSRCSRKKTVAGSPSARLPCLRTFSSSGEAVAMKISVAMCTFNGGPFLGEQLQSIAAQDRPPDELVICDDGSTDETLDAVGRFARSVPLPVRLEINRQRLGSSANFAKAVGMCRGDWIFLADQDDFWPKGKVRRMLEPRRDFPDQASSSATR